MLPPPGAGSGTTDSLPPDAPSEDRALDDAVAFAGEPSGEASLDSVPPPAAREVSLDSVPPPDEDDEPAEKGTHVDAPPSAGTVRVAAVVVGGPSDAASAASAVQVVRHSLIPVGVAPASAVPTPSQARAPQAAREPESAPQPAAAVEPKPEPEREASSSADVRPSIAPVRPSAVPGTGFQRPTSVLDARPSLQPDSVPAPSGIGWGALAGIAVMAAIVAAAAVIAIRERLATHTGSETAAMAAQPEPAVEPGLPAAEAPHAPEPDDSLDNQPAAADPQPVTVSALGDAALASAGDGSVADAAVSAATASPDVSPVPTPIAAPSTTPLPTSGPVPSAPPAAPSAPKPEPLWRQQLRAQQAAAAAARAAARAAAATARAETAAGAAAAPAAAPPPDAPGEIPEDPYVEPEAKPADAPTP